LESDVSAIAAFGANLITVGISYAVFPELGSAATSNNTTCKNGFDYLDALLNWTQNAQIFTIITLKAAPGCQNSEGFCSENKQANLWSNTAMQNQTVALWKAIAARYSNVTSLVGFDLLSAPSGVSNDDLKAFYQLLVNGIREVDSNHILFLEGVSATDFSVFEKRWVLELDSNAGYGAQVYASDLCPILSNYQLDVDDLLSSINDPVSTDNRVIFVSEYGGKCSDWLQGALARLEDTSHVQFQPTAYYSYKGTNSQGTPAPAFSIVSATAWNYFIGELVTGVFATDAEWDSGFAALTTPNFAANTDYSNTLKDYFAGKTITYAYYGYYIIGAILLGAVIIAVALVVGGILYKRRKKNYSYY